MKWLGERGLRTVAALALATAGAGASALGACGPSGGTSDAATPDGSAQDAAPDAAPGDAGTRCPRALGPADGPRHVVVSHPFDSSGNAGKAFELLALDAAGSLTTTGVTFQMGTALGSPIAFTPDGNVALVAQEDGTIGVVRFDGNVPVVVHAAFQGSFYAGRVVMDPRGDRAWVLDEDTAQNGGGVYEVDIACDGTLTDRGLIVPGGGAFGMEFLPGSLSAVLSATAAFDSGATADTEIVDLSDAGALVSSGAVFPEGGAIVSDIAVTPDGRFALLADDGLFAGNRVAVAELPTLAPRDVLSVLSPAALVASPFDNAALVLSSDGNDAIRLASYSPDASTPFSIVGEIAYVHGKPQLPSFAATIRRGTLAGLVLVAENTAVRSVRLYGDGGAADVAMLSFGSGLQNIVGVIGAAP